MPSGADPADSKPYRNVIARISQFADDNLTIVRNLSTCVGIAGLLIIARSVRLVTKFSSASEIPARFIERNVSIRGRLRNITEQGLEVEHIPLYVPLLSRLLAKPQARSLLDVRLAGVEMSSEGQDWIARQLNPTQTLWLRLIARQNQSLQCLVSVSRGSLFSTCVNEELLRQGLARTCPLEGLDPHSQIYWSLCQRLLRAERRAQRTGKGLWKEDTHQGLFRSNILLRSVNKLFRWTSGTREK